LTRSRRHPDRDRRGSATPAGDPGAGRWLQELAAIARDPSRWAALDEDSLLLIAFQQCLYFAHTRDPEAADALAELYPHVASRVGTPERMELLDRVTAAVEEGETPVLALLPFLQHEPDPGAVALAGVAFATLAPLDRGDEMSGPRAIVRMAELAEDDGTRTGLLGSLLQLGDRRVLPLVREGWRALPPAARVLLAGLRSPSSLAYASVVEFWLEALDDDDDTVADAAADALARVPAEADPPRVLDVRRKFPANAPDERDEIEITADETLAQHAARIEPRLHELLRRGGAAGRLARVRAAWGLPAA
jgi:hypothetical protein